MPKVNTIKSPKSGGILTRSRAAKFVESHQAPSKKTKITKSETLKPESKNKIKKDEAKKKGKENAGDKTNKNKEKKENEDKNIRLEKNPPKDGNGRKKNAATPKPIKRRRIILPDEDSDAEVDSGDEYKPDSDVSQESDEGSLSEAVSDSEPASEKDSDDETPKKKRKVNNGTAAKSSAKKSIKSDIPLRGIELTAPKASNTQSWPHLKYEFLQPDKIKDAKMRSPEHPDYDPRTLYVPQDFLDTQTPAMRQWWVLKSSHYDCVLLFQLAKWYLLYHMDAVIGVNEMNLSFMRGELRGQFALSGFPESAYGRCSAGLIERGYKVARIEQTETPEMAAKRCARMKKSTKFDKVVNREICQISTRGTKIYTAQDTEAAAPTSSYLLSIVEKQTTGLPSYGVCFIDTSIGEFHLGQFQDDRCNSQDDRCNSRLLTLIAHHPPAHIVYERGNLSPTTLKIINNYLPNVMKEALQKEVQFWTSTKVLKTLYENNYFKKEGDESEFTWPTSLQPFLNKADSSQLMASEDKELAINALGGCVYLLKEYMLDQQLLSLGRFKIYSPPDFTSIKKGRKKKTQFAHNMVLDAITINNLRILGSDGSLIEVLDKCCTAFGKRLIREWICRPSCRKSVIIERQEAITQLLDNPDIVAEVRSKLSTLPDIDRLLSKIHAHGNAAKLQNHPDSRAILFDANLYSKRKINDFITVLNSFEEILAIIKKFSVFDNPLISKCTRLEPEGDFPDLNETVNHFKNAFNHEQAKKEGFIIPKRGVDREYDAVLLELAEIKKESEAYLDKQKKHFGVQIKYCGGDKKRFQIEVPESQIKKVGNGYELQGSRKGFKRYYTAESREFLARQIAAEEQKEKVLKDSNRKIFAKFSEEYEQWSNAAYNIAVLDCLISLSEYARTCDVCIPTVYDDTDGNEIMIEIRDGKHPCIPSDNFIPNDTCIATEETAPLILLTGPNMGGKSTLMRQVGLITVMAQIGCHVPASACQLTLVDRIFTRLGANDDIMAGQSTFLVELSETAAILQHATTHSLVLLDELGRGTSTYDGTAIAASVVDALTKKKCRTLFSTHYHSLVEDFKDNTNVSSAHMACMVENEDEGEVTEQNVTFLYKLSQGACPKSYGFNAARLAGIPAHITKRAQEIATKLENEVNLRHAFTTLCKINDGLSMKSVLKSLTTL
ncbi:LOW QUALITY PROTEIN: probable DNA mismatch repair protein Msh6 [Copidosoma floridanum]|uniref:LOW QUALITY PROTEIN: probable DNA mismatch repair protein Msh6 n=1 Tax=Copidosoma floridanum TaxID=29053 RepID=UPI000C6F67DA|nr:LOW QUALITY PROTEIN: probable DNA mismatch repair protein Msh6 [Copidosoma floridanum]